jgi:hypothetical protein
MAKNKSKGIDLDAILCCYCSHYEEAVMRGKEEILSFDTKSKKYKYWRLCPETIEQVDSNTIACPSFVEAKYFWCDSCCQRLAMIICFSRQRDDEECVNFRGQCHSLKMIMVKKQAEQNRKSFKRIQITEE